jgi:hypothetical protein
MKYSIEADQSSISLLHSKTLLQLHLRCSEKRKLDTAILEETVDRALTTENSKKRSKSVESEIKLIHSKDQRK